VLHGPRLVPENPAIAFETRGDYAMAMTEAPLDDAGRRSGVLWALQDVHKSYLSRGWSW